MHLMLCTRSEISFSVSLLSRFISALKEKHDHAVNMDDRKSTSCFIFLLNGCCVSWKSTKQKTVSISSTESEYIALSGFIQEALWIRSLLNELGFQQQTTRHDKLYVFISHVFYIKSINRQNSKAYLQKLASIVKQKLLHPMIIIIDNKKNSNIIYKTIKLYSEVRKYQVNFDNFTTFIV